MSEDDLNATAAATIDGLFARLGAQLGDLAASEKQQGAAVAAVGKTVDQPALTQVVEAGVARHAALARSATAVAGALRSPQRAVSNDLATLMTVAGRGPTAVAEGSDDV